MKTNAKGFRQRFTTLESSDCAERDLCTFFIWVNGLFIVVVGLKKAFKVRLGEDKARAESRARLFSRWREARRTRLWRGVPGAFMPFSLFFIAFLCGLI